MRPNTEKRGKEEVRKRERKRRKGEWGRAHRRSMAEGSSQGLAMGELWCSGWTREPDTQIFPDGGSAGRGMPPRAALEENHREGRTVREWQKVGRGRKQCGRERTESRERKPGPEGASLRENLKG